VSLSNPEFQKRFRKISDASGGSTRGEVATGGLVVDSKYGEFLVSPQKGGELMTFFPEKGLMCGYSASGELEFCVFDLYTVFADLDEESLARMIHNGQDILGVMDCLMESGGRLSLSVFPKLGAVQMKLDVEGFKTVEKGYRYDDFCVERTDTITLDDTVVAFSISREADEFAVGFGEIDGDLVTLCSYYLSHRISIPQDLKKTSSRGLQTLATKILLND